MLHEHGKIQAWFRASCWRRASAAAGCLWLLSAAPAVVGQDKLIKEGDTWRFFRGSQEPPPDWKDLNFNDGGWEEGPTPIGYGPEIPATGTMLTDMANSYLSVYVRRKFTIPSLGAIPAVNLRIKYDDGFVAYLNGVEVLRKSMPGAPGDPVPFDAVATDHEGTAFEDNLFCTSALSSLRNGENVLAIQGHNVNLTSSDLQVVPEFISISNVCAKDFTCRGTAANIILRWVKPTTTFAFDDLQLWRDGVQVSPGPTKTAATFTDRNPPPGPHNYELRTTSCGGQCSVLTCTGQVGGGAVMFRRGDSDGNAAVNLSDAIFVLNHLFVSGPGPTCPDAADADDTGALNITDAVFLLNALFAGGPQPPSPGISTCGPDGTATDTLATCTYTC